MNGSIERRMEGNNEERRERMKLKVREEKGGKEGREEGRRGEVYDVSVLEGR